MFYKLLYFILIYLLTIIDFVIILLPLWVMLVPIYLSFDNHISKATLITVILLVLLVASCLVLIIMFFDFLFAFSVKGHIKNSKEYMKIKNYDVFKDIFEDIKLHFNNHKVKLMIEESTVENAYAVGNLGRQYIIITKGLVNMYLMELKNAKYFLTCMKCIMGHEMSHLINKDYLPGLILSINERAIRFVSTIIYKFFNIFIVALNYIPFIGSIFSNIVLFIYNLIDRTINFFYKYIILSIYKFLQLKISRTAEYRCDLQSAKINGGVNMAQTLSALGESGYSTIFSSHPKTSDRMKYVKDIEKVDIIIKPEFGNGIINFISILFMLTIPLILYYFINLKVLENDYYTISMLIITKFNYFKLKILSLFGK